MIVKKNDFNQELYIEKVDSAHDKLKGLETQIGHMEEITDAGLFQKFLVL